MSFHGKPQEQAPEAPAEVRSYKFTTWGGKLREIEADFVTFNPGHVAFWKRRPDNLQDTLIAAVTNAEVNNLEEIKK